MAPAAGAWDAAGSCGWSAVDSSSETWSAEAFHRLDELWDIKWQGDRFWPTSHPTVHDLRSTVWTSDLPFDGVCSRSSFDSQRPDPYGRSPSLPSLQAKSTRGLLRRVKSWLQQIDDKRRGIVYTSTGPCQLFADYGIPPYPEDYDWDE